MRSKTVKLLLKVLFGLSVLALCSCAQLPKNYEREKTTHLTDTADTGLGLRSLSMRMSDLDDTRIVPINDGVEAFYTRAVLANSAERSLDIQYFLWHKDVTGQVLLKYVLDAADRGVRVRMLLDDLDNQALDEEFYALDRHPNISIRLFNPFATRGFKYIDFFVDTSRVNRRMHNKSFVADNQYAILGGRNIGDEYFDAKEEANFYDFDVIISGPAVDDVSKAFDVYWNHETAVPVNAFSQDVATDEDLAKLRTRLTKYLQAQRESKYARDVTASPIYKALKTGDYTAYEDYFGEARVVYDHPDKGLGKAPEEYVSMQDLIGPYLAKAKREIFVISPYYVPGDSSAQAAVDLVKDGMFVGIITNSYGSTDSPVVHAGYSRYREQLLAGGVHIYELKTTSRRSRRKGSVAYDSAANLHTKMFVIDRELVFVGSMNLDPRSIDINTEMGVLFHSPELAELLMSRLGAQGLQHVYELELVRSPPESKGEFTTYTWDIEWIEHIGGKTVRHASEPDVGVWDSFLLFLMSAVPESQI